MADIIRCLKSTNVSVPWLKGLEKTSNTTNVGLLSELGETQWDHQFECHRTYNFNRIKKKIEISSTTFLGVHRCRRWSEGILPFRSVEGITRRGRRRIGNLLGRARRCERVVVVFFFLFHCCRWVLWNRKPQIHQRAYFSRLWFNFKLAHGLHRLCRLVIGDLNFRSAK